VLLSAIAHVGAAVMCTGIARIKVHTASAIDSVFLAQSASAQIGPGAGRRDSAA
jgi:hypothetical protein